MHQYFKQLQQWAAIEEDGDVEEAGKTFNHLFNNTSKYFSNIQYHCLQNC